MPIYEYKCDKCGKISEILQKHFDVDEAPCEACGAPAHRIMSNTSFVLKGTGWYVTDYKGNGGCSAAGDAANGKAHAAKSEDSSASSTTTASDSSSSCSKAPSGGCSSCSSTSSSASAAS
ncbi:regulatory protein, FmdB family [Solidesulfovibrio fructosivorans JJ]]|uniref:Regulatory protein, FmdB family n=1 Tax=Solidesulfovibrio fructosivorans JJ] TaxID=596151 RepID=E1JZ63_SOLFR|nr:FmdB family zinc ribbon protein [Solidesulfovibrio fructosivorans]EFL50346.1 regulatory protein, FmdB family [Solidesulfovibrio fructosivorans JJ]]